jgi:two-component system sensor histidine kinase/response regulator
MRKPYHILLADDNVVNQTVARGMLEHVGYQVDTVRDGTEVIQALEKNHYDLVVMDCLMPGMDGFTATRIIRGSSPARFDVQIPIIATTALTSERDRDKCFDAGMTDHISKPIIAKTFLALIAGYLGSGADLENEQRLPLDGRAALPEDEAQARFQAHVLNSMSQRIVSDAELWQQKLKTFGNAGEFDKLGSLAHKIRGTADIIGKKELSELAQNLETSAGVVEQEQARKLAFQLIKELQNLILELRQDS